MGRGYTYVYPFCAYYPFFCGWLGDGKFRWDSSKHIISYAGRLTASWSAKIYSIWVIHLSLLNPLLVCSSEAHLSKSTWLKLFLILSIHQNELAAIVSRLRTCNFSFKSGIKYKLKPPALLNGELSTMKLRIYFCLSKCCSHPVHIMPLAIGYASPMDWREDARYTLK